MKLAIVASPGPGNPHLLAAQLRQGVRISGDECTIFPDIQHLGNAIQYDRHEYDAVCCWGLRRQIKLEKEYGIENVLVMERAYVGDRFTWVSMGWNGLNGRAKFPQCDDNGERWAQYFQHHLMPWRDIDEGYALILGQVPSDAAVMHVDYLAWLNTVTTTLVEAGWNPADIKFRPHPEARGIRLGGFETLKGSLTEALDGAQFVINFNSNSGVDAVKNGIPCVTMDEGSMAYSVTSHDLMNPIYKPDRMQWAHQLAFCQWLPEELSNGSAWQYARRCIEA